MPLLAVSEELTRFAGLQPLYDGINHLDPVYYRKDEVLRMLEKCTGLNDSQQEQLTGAIMVFMDIVKKTDLNPLQLKSIKILNMWWKIYPDLKPWNALKWLWQEGIEVAHSQSGYRAWRRFPHGSNSQNQQKMPAYIQKNGWKYARSKTFLKLPLKQIVCLQHFPVKGVMPVWQVFAVIYQIAIIVS